MIRNDVLPLANVLHVNVEANTLVYNIIRDMIELVSYFVLIKNSILSNQTYTISQARITTKVKLANNIVLSNKDLRAIGNMHAAVTLAWGQGFHNVEMGSG
jgi:hypothetical protein